ncbi:MAG: SDR family NAD(P)-dependent oxidoreductase [Planctomycetota bacterium]
MVERPAEQHVALVTGGGGGIGEALCLAIGGAGAFVIVTGRNQVRCGAVAERVREAGGMAEAVALDVTDIRSIGTALSRILELAGPVDWLVNNAGFVTTAPLVAPEQERDLYRAHMDVNFHGARAVLEATLPGMLDLGYGQVVQIASSAALYGYSYVSAYAASKHALLGYSRSAAHELAPRLIGVNVICPHYVESPMTDASVALIAQRTGRQPAHIRSFLASENPGGVMVTPEEVARLALDFLESERTGVVVELLGGGEREVDAGWRLEEPV